MDVPGYGKGLGVFVDFFAPFLLSFEATSDAFFGLVFSFFDGAMVGFSLWIKCLVYFY
jgi:hypothetical protein